MMLFFETGTQIYTFLFSILVGMLLGLSLDHKTNWGIYGFICDLLLVLSAACLLTGLVFFDKEECVSVFHLLGCIVGIWLYAKGIGQIKASLTKRLLLKEGVDLTNDE